MTEHTPPPLNLEAAAGLVGLPAPALEALAASGYLAAIRGEDGATGFQLPDLKAFVARNEDNGSGVGFFGSTRALEPEELIELLGDRAEAMARRLLRMCVEVFPASRRWTDRQQAKFVRITKARFESVLAVAALGSRVDGSFYRELHEVGASAARSGTALPDLLMMLRMSRDLVVQNAVELAGIRDRPGGFALSLLLTRILPALDRISDALTEGYWETLAPNRG